MNANQPRYDRKQTYQWNYDHSPVDTPSYDIDETPVTGDWKFCSRSIPSPIGIAAGPLLNGQWCLYYARLGFDVLTYKTVRSRQRDCYALPNLQSVPDAPLLGEETHVDAVATNTASWAVSFGMPSATPDAWRRDIERTRQRLPLNKLLAVSVVGTMQIGWGIDELASDYAKCARWAVESGADCVETNFSCPNVSTCDGQLYQNSVNSRQVCEAVRDAIGDTPYVVKIGYVSCDQEAQSIVRAMGDKADALAMTNSIAAQVRHHGVLMFDKQKRGICGVAIRNASIRQVERFATIINRLKLDTKIVGIGGIQSADDVRAYLRAGAHHCQLATAAMLDPMVGISIRRNMHSVNDSSDH